MSERSAKTTRRQIRRAFTPELAASIDANFALLVKQIKQLQARIDALEGLVLPLNTGPLVIEQPTDIIAKAPVRIIHQ